MNAYPDDQNLPFDDLARKLAEEIARQIDERMQYMERAETLLEGLIKQDLVEILTNKDGQFTYRMTRKGMKTYTDQTGLAAPTSDLTFHELFPL